MPAEDQHNGKDTNRPVQPAVNAWEADYIEAQYERWLADPNSVDASWREFFRGFDLGYRPSATAEGDRAATDIAHSKQGKVDRLIWRYRKLGHFAADLDPLGTQRPRPEELDPASLELSEQDMDERFDPGTLPLDNPSPLREIISLLEDTYCRHIGVEYMHIQDREQRRWLEKRMEPARNKPDVSQEQKMRILRELMEADAFENFLDTRYKGKKRFALDGGESIVPTLNEIIDLAPDHGIKELTIGMTHRGRLNVLANIMNKTYDQIFTEFEEAWVEDFLESGGDVKYHRGYSSTATTASGENVRLTLTPNPSHLEHVNPVTLGRARAKQRLRNDTQRTECVPILMHGDAAFPAQGVVAECFNYSQLPGYTVGGTVHLVVNNQIGFTTDQEEGWSGHYCTDIAKILDVPIFHVNGHDPEACVWVAMLALEYRQAFKRDVVIDMWCYRKFGHNEGDEPTFTQPLMYQRIKEQQPVYQCYVDQLVEEGTIERDKAKKLYDDLKQTLDESHSRSKEQPVRPTQQPFQNVWSGLTAEYSDDPVETGVPRGSLEKVAHALGSVPDDFNPHRKLKKLLDMRRAGVEEEKPLDWGMGEMYAYGTLLLEGHAVRLTGQDTARGTFSHRHAVLVDQQNNEKYVQLNHIADGQGRFCIYNSPLSESGCVGFEYGYSLGDPNMLVLWEAQFGDFANGAQVFFDQFIASAEAKWKRFSGLVCLLPHGYEGQGPEHSSARLERFLTLCADNNMQVVYPTTPAQLFHLLRRQVKRNFRKPLIVMSPKSLLRHPKATSHINEMINDRFHHVLDDPAIEEPKKVQRLVLCSGKVYYDLIAHREKCERDDVAVVRLEQLYPLRLESLQPVLDKYAHAEKVWVQEEPKNMGAWRYIDARLREELDLDLPYIGRDENASPAVASFKMHQQEQEKILVSAIGLPSEPSEDETQQPEQLDADEEQPVRAKAS